MSFEGGCYCGEVRYEAGGDPIFKGQCCCRECQYVSGGGPNYTMGMPAASFRYTKGEPKAFRRSDLDGPVTREFCDACGTQLVSRSPNMAAAVMLKVGTLDGNTITRTPEHDDARQLADQHQLPLRTILDVNGAMRVIAIDADGDGRPDFIALITQQHEAIVQFVNRGDGKFDNRIVTRANHPSFGSSNIRLADLDQDGDEDILYTNGDMMDENPEAKPYHGLRWLENDGRGNYTLHYLAGMPGCYDAEPVDLDGDGDLDVVFSSLNFLWPEHDFPSLAWLENRGGFRDVVPRRIAYAPTNLAKIAIGDANGDGKPDILGCGMHVPGPLDRKGRLTLWIAR